MVKATVGYSRLLAATGGGDGQTQLPNDISKNPSSASTVWGIIVSGAIRKKEVWSQLYVRCIGWKLGLSKSVKSRKSFARLSRGTHLKFFCRLTVAKLLPIRTRVY